MAEVGETLTGGCGINAAPEFITRFLDQACLGKMMVEFDIAHEASNPTEFVLLVSIPGHSIGLSAAEARTFAELINDTADSVANLIPADDVVTFKVLADGLRESADVLDAFAARHGRVR